LQHRIYPRILMRSCCNMPSHDSHRHIYEKVL